MKNDKKIIISKLKNTIDASNNFDIDDFTLNKIVEKNDKILTKQKKCGVCNKKYKGKNRFYGSSCIKNLYNNANVISFKEIDDKELFLYSVIVLRLGKLNINEKEMRYVCESYLSKLYFEELTYPNTSIIKEQLDKCIYDNSKPIMKLNTAYRINKVLKRNKKVLKTNDIEIFIDKKIINFFKSYFLISKLNNPAYYEICYYMQLIFWELIVLGGLFSDYELASKCLQNSLCVIGQKTKNFNITDNDKTIISKIKNDKNFELKIKKLIKKYAINDEVVFNKNSDNYANNSSYEFKNGDLFYSLHKVNLSFEGKRKNNKWDLKVVLIDKYDFTELLSDDYLTKTDKKYLNLGTMLNDMALISSQYGVIQGFDIKISFKWSILDE